MTVFEDLKWRGLVQDISDEALIEKINKGKIKLRIFFIGLFI